MATQLKPDQAYAYAELLEILTFTDESLVKKLPNKLMRVFNENALPTYENHLDSSIPLEDQEISQKTAALIALLSLNYWCETEEEKNELKAILAENDRLKEQELREKYNPDNIFNNSTVSSEKKEPAPARVVSSQQEVSDSASLPMDYSSLPWYKKIFTSFKNFIFKIFKKQNNPT